MTIRANSQVLLPISPKGATDEAALSFAQVYESEFEFVWRTLRRLGVSPGQIEDALQEVFVVVHRRLAEFERRSSTRTWIFAIARHVAMRQRRSSTRRARALPEEPSDGAVDHVGDRRAPAGDAVVERAEDLRVLETLLDALDDDRRAVFVLVELEEMTMPEVAEALSINLNTAYSRLRAARLAFEQAAARHRAREGGRP